MTISSHNIGCMASRCGRTAAVRGLCKMHYRQLVRAVKVGKTTYAEAERLGFCLPSREAESRKRWNR